MKPRTEGLVPINPALSDYEVWRLWRLSGLPTTGAHQIQYQRIYKRAMASVYGTWTFQTPIKERIVQMNFERRTVRIYRKEKMAA